MIRKTVRLFVVLLLSCSAPGFAQQPQQPFPFPIPLPFPNFQGTAEEQNACKPDVVRLCPDTVRDQSPDTTRILACLQRNRAGLKQACRTVLQNHGV